MRFHRAGGDTRTRCGSKPFEGVENEAQLEFLATRATMRAIISRPLPAELCTQFPRGADTPHPQQRPTRVSKARANAVRTHLKFDNWVHPISTSGKGERSAVQRPALGSC
jgi:hypothetical protein